jgi:hypothetical protein
MSRPDSLHPTGGRRRSWPAPRHRRLRLRAAVALPLAALRRAAQRLMLPMARPGGWRHALPAVVSFGLAALAAPAQAQDDVGLRNWGEDPFVQLRADDARCPEPRGPRMTAAEWRSEAHWRIETGTSCWLAGRCADANAYRYDGPIAQALFPRLQGLPELAGGSLWVYLQRRIAFVQGCVADRAQAQAVEAAIGRAAAAVPDVQMVVPALRVAGDEGTPYRRLDPR